MNRDYEALKIRYEALAKDWDRLRDIERQWLDLRNWVLLAGAFVMGLAATLLIGGVL